MSAFLDKFAEPIPWTLTVRTIVSTRSCVATDNSCPDTRLSISTVLVCRLAECKLGSRTKYAKGDGDLPGQAGAYPPIRL